MSFTDTLKRSLGFEETESTNKNPNEGPSFVEYLREMGKSRNGNSQQQNARSPYNQPPVQNSAPTPNRPAPKPVYDDFEYIVPEQSLYEVVLIRPKTIDDINYVVDQVIEENNPVILDLSFLEKESPANFKLAGDKIKQMRAHYGVQALLLARSSEKNLILVSPKKVAVQIKV